MNLFKEQQLGDHVNIHMYNTNKFKTTALCFYINDNLDENAALNALLPRILKSGSNTYKNSTIISEYLEELYGASFGVDIIKKGEVQSILFYLQFVEGQYVKDILMFKKAIDFICDIVLNPIIENNSFKEEYVVTEKKILEDMIASRKNDKIQYAVERCMQISCKGTPFEIYKYGEPYMLEKINASNLYEHYRKILRENPIDIYIAGSVSEEEALSYIKERFVINRENIENIRDLNMQNETREKQLLHETMDINQGKLCLGYRTNMSFAHENFPALSVYTGILGGGMNSKLFLNMREKENLAYYAYSGIEKFKGLLLVNCGIEVENYERSVNIIEEQVEDMRKGNITDSEIDNSIKKIMSDLKTINDNVPLMIDYNLGGMLYGKEIVPEDMMKKVEKVKKEDIIEAAQGIKLDTIFFLSSKDKERKYEYH
ncbi:peptidase M16 inactive domain protein [Oxobacter pfennigii]|uniref:Peptidase M16 inactive domain protein n=1 Tax=Oxobacter pfennigii TaxID=36849 RepID=A0A0N8NT75_9CLOT|nr:insulinase family protein [Oxobacter pfennigii]KPU44048.1 peptidase M16 inactive domain protein [Oxobacter pfennigii]